jgi:hypothetical protein
LNAKVQTQPRFPNDSQRLFICGRTGSGKTQAGVWHLSGRSYDEMPWLILDFKRDELIAQIPAQEIQLGSRLPSKPGLYVVRPIGAQEDAIEKLLWQIHAKENCGLYVDEGYMLDARSQAFQAIMTQGRSLHIPVIILSQRPVWISRFVVSEADFLQVFRLNDERDYQTLRAFIPYDVSSRLRALPEYHSIYYDMGKDRLNVFTPVPDRDTILGSFRAAIRPKRSFI